MFFLFINKTLRLNNLKTWTVMNEEISALVVWYFQNIMIIVSKDHKITEGILIAHWDIFWTNPINITKNSASLLFHLNYAFISKIVHCIPLGLGNVIISKAHVENVDLFKSKMNGFQFTKKLHFTMKKIKAGFYLE